MRVVLLVLLFLISACSAPAESAQTTTTAIVPAAVATTEATTMTTLAPTTTTGSECVERDGVLYDSRGFVCPPRMSLDQDQLRPLALFHRPGTYTTRVFEPTISFTRDAVFHSFGENPFLVSLDARPTCDAAECFKVVNVLSPGFVGQLEEALNDDLDWIHDLTSSPVEYLGYAGIQIDFRVDTCSEEGDLPCSIPIEGLSFWGYPEFTANRLLMIEVPGGPVGFDIGAHQSRFDQYWTEVAEPILQSIEFSDG